MKKRRGMSYRKRVEDINRIYDRYAMPRAEQP